jgi:hypothetical protein
MDVVLMGLRRHIKAVSVMVFIMYAVSAVVIYIFMPWWYAWAWQNWHLALLCLIPAALMFIMTFLGFRFYPDNLCFWLYFSSEEDRKAAIRKVAQDIAVLRMILGIEGSGPLLISNPQAAENMIESLKKCLGVMGIRDVEGEISLVLKHLETMSSEQRDQLKHDLARKIGPHFSCPLICDDRECFNMT